MNVGTSVRPVWKSFECGKTQISHILRNKDQANTSGRRIHKSKSHTSKVNDALYKWFTLVCSRNVHHGGPELMGKAKDIAEKLGKPDFKACRGWLVKWKKRYNMKQWSICGESGDVRKESWKERISEIVQAYKKEDVWNMDETGIFWCCFTRLLVWPEV